MGRASTPLKVLSNGDLRAFTEEEERYLAYEAGRYFSSLDSSDGGLLTASSTNSEGANVSVGGFTDTIYDQSVGAHTSLSFSQTQHPLWQNYQWSRPAKSNDFRNLISWDYSLGGIKEMDDDELTTLVRRLSKTIMENEYPGTFRVAATNPGSDWIAYKQNYYTDTRTDGTTTNYTLWLRTKGQASNAHSGRVLPATLKRSSGGSGSYSGFQKISDTQLSNTLGSKIRDLIGELGGTGRYTLIPSYAAAPSPGTWVARGTITDTRQEIVDIDYASTSVPEYIGDFTGDFVTSVNFQSTRGSINSVEYLSSTTQNFVGDYILNYLGSTTSVSTSTKTTTQDFTGDYTADYLGSTTSTSTSTKTSSRNFTGNYIADFVGFVNYNQDFLKESSKDFIANFVGDFLSFVNVNRTRTSVTSTTQFLSDYIGDFITSTEKQYTRTQTRKVTTTDYYTGDFVGFTNRTATTTDVYVGDFVGNFLADYVGSTDYIRSIGEDAVSTTNYTGDYAGNFLGDFITSAYDPQNFLKDYVTTFVADYTGSADFIKSSTTGFLANYIGDYLGNYVGSVYEQEATDSTYVGNYLGDFIGDFTGSTTRTSTISKTFLGESTRTSTVTTITNWDSYTVSGSTRYYWGYPQDPFGTTYWVQHNYSEGGTTHSANLAWKQSQKVVLRFNLYGIPSTVSSLKIRVTGSNINVRGLTEDPAPTIYSGIWNWASPYTSNLENGLTSITPYLATSGSTKTTYVFLTYNVPAIGNYSLKFDVYDVVNSGVTSNPSSADETVNGSGTAATSGAATTTNYTGNFIGNYIGQSTRSFVSSANFQRENTAFDLGSTSTVYAAFIADYIGSIGKRYIDNPDSTVTYTANYTGDFTGSVNSTVNTESTGSTASITKDFLGYVNQQRTDEYQTGSNTDFTADYTGDYTGSTQSSASIAKTYTVSAGEDAVSTTDFLADYINSANFIRSVGETGVSATNFLADFVGDYLGDFLSFLNVNRTRTSVTSTTQFLSDYIGDFITSTEKQKTRASTTTDSYIGDYTGDFITSIGCAVNTESIRTSNYAGNFVGDFTGSTTTSGNTESIRTSTYAGNFVGDFIGFVDSTVNTESTRTSTYAGNYLGFVGAEYLGDYTGPVNSTTIYTSTRTADFVGEYAASTIAATSETIETFTLYVRIE